MDLKVPPVEIIFIPFSTRKLMIISRFYLSDKLTKAVLGFIIVIS